MLLFSAGIIFFCFFYTALVFNPKETADNLKKSGAFIPGIRPGEQTARYIDTVMTRLTLAGAIYVTPVCLLPEFLILAWKCSFLFRWYIFVDYCSCCDGLYGSSPSTYDVVSI